MKIDLNLPDKVFGMEVPLLLEYLPLLGVMILMLISWSVLISPKLSDISGIKTNSATIKSETKLILEKINYLRSVDQEELNKKNQLLTNALIKEKNSYYLVGVVKDLAAKNGFSLVSFTVSPGKLNEDPNENVNKSKKAKAANDGITPLPVTLVLNGPAEKYDQLIADMEKGIPILAISNLEMKQGGGVALLNMTVTAYYAAEKADMTIAKLSLKDLMLSNEENKILETIGQYRVYAKVGSLEGTEEQQKEFVKYQRENPFLP